VNIDFTLFGEAVSKANSRRIVPFGQKEVRDSAGEVVGTRPMMRNIKSEKAIDFEDVGFQIPTFAQLRLDGPIRIQAIICYTSARPDLDESLLLDILQDQHKFVGKGKGRRKYLWRPGVYINDRQVVDKHIMRGPNTDQPRIDIRIEQLFMWAPKIEGFATIEQQQERERLFREQHAVDAPAV
jgi:hypothetical protein